MVRMKALAALAIVVAGAVAGFAVYTFGWHSGGETRVSHGVPVKTVKNAAGTHRVYTLRDGDVALRPEAAVRCEASAEGGLRNFFCTRTGGGRHQVIFYDDDVLVWPLDCRACGPDGPVFTYRWERAQR
jgi:hypothetical protein